MSVSMRAFQRCVGRLVGPRNCLDMGILGKFSSPPARPLRPRGLKALAPGLPMKLCWGEVKKDFSAGALRSEMKIEDALALLHGAKSATFYKKARGVKREQDWLCFSLVFKERTLDFAATNAQALLDWYLGLAQLIPHSTEPLLDEPTLRGRIGRML